MSAHIISEREKAQKIESQRRIAAAADRVERGRAAPVQLATVGGVGAERVVAVAVGQRAQIVQREIDGGDGVGVAGAAVAHLDLALLQTTTHADLADRERLERKIAARPALTLV